MRRSDGGRGRSGPRRQDGSGGGADVSATRGISMRCSSSSMVANSTCGARWTRTATSSHPGSVAPQSAHSVTDDLGRESVSVVAGRVAIHRPTLLKGYVKWSAHMGEQQGNLERTCRETDQGIQRTRAAFGRGLKAIHAAAEQKRTRPDGLPDRVEGLMERLIARSRCRRRKCYSRTPLNLSRAIRALLYDEAPRQRLAAANRPTDQRGARRPAHDSEPPGGWGDARGQFARCAPRTCR